MAERLLKVKGTQLYYQDYSEAEHLLTGSVVEGTFDGNLKVKGTYIHWMGNDGVQRRLLGTLTGNTGTAGKLWNKGNYLYYIDNNSDERCLALRKPPTRDMVFIGTSVWGQGILNQGMITRTPNGDLYASCGDMGQNHDLDPEAGHPIEIWHSDDDGATWAVSKTIYVEGYYFGGGGNGVCIASDSAGLVHVAFAVRRYVGSGGVKSRNICFYLHGKHGDWGGTYNIFQIEMADYPQDALPKVTGLEVDSNDLAHILYSQAFNTDYNCLYYLWDPGSGQFQNTIISDDTHGTLGGRNRLVIDGDNTVSVVYGHATDEKYYYKQKPSGGGWSSSVWLGKGGWYANHAIAVDRYNTKHIAIYEGDKGYYRTRTSAGAWGDIEEWIGLKYSAPSISILPDGTVYIVAHKTYTSLIIRRRDPNTGLWSTLESWAETGGGWGVCMLHSYHPIVDEQHVCIFDNGWAFHWRPSHDDSFYWADP